MRIILFLALLFPVSMVAQDVPDDPLAHTYSIVARDAVTGEIGVAVQSHWFSVGSIVSWAEAGVGAIATQSFVNVSFGPRGLALLKAGLTAQETLDKLIREDEGRDFRQLAIVDAKGNVAAYTGAKCIEGAGDLQGDGFSVQANMMLTDTVPGAMKAAYEANADLPLAERMMSALQAAEGEGGDVRGRQSAAILVVKPESTGKIWEDRIIDLRVEDHPNAPAEIARVLKVYRAYEHMNAGDLAVEHNDIDGALREYNAASDMFPENIEMKYWTAVSLANAGRIDDALPIFKTVFKAEPNWVALTRRIVPNGMLQVDTSTLTRILMQREQ